MAGTLFVVATPIGNLDDLSSRALRVLREVAVIAAEDTRHTGHLLQRFGLTTRTVSFHEHSDKGKAEALIERLRSGDSVALVSDAGTPTISDPGSHLVHLAHQAGIRVEPIPGPSAVVTALSASGFSSDGFVFLGFPPNNGTARAAWFDRLRSAAAIAPNIVFYEAPHRIERTIADLHHEIGDVEVLVARELTKAHEELSRGRLSTLEIGTGRGEYTVVVNFGETTNKQAASAVPPATNISLEFGHMTTVDKLTRRQAMSALARRHHLSARQIFSLLEEAKNSVV